MIVKAVRYEKFLKARGAGVFGKVEYDDQDQIILRTSDVRTADLSGTVRLFFNNQREQLMTGRRFDPMPSGLVLLRPGAFYRIHSTIEVVKPLPKGVSAIVTLNEAAMDVMVISAVPYREGYVGPLAFMIQPFRRIELEKMTSIAGLMFFEETVNIDGKQLKVLEDRISVRVMKRINSDGTKRSTKSASKGPAAPESAPIIKTEKAANG